MQLHEINDQELTRRYHFHDTDIGTMTVDEECRRMHFVQELHAELERRGLMANGIVHKFPVGARIQARDPVSNVWRDAVVARLKPYRGRPGYDCSWDPLPTDLSQSQGGWQYDATVRTRPQA